MSGGSLDYFSSDSVDKASGHLQEVEEFLEKLLASGRYEGHEDTGRGTSRRIELTIDDAKRRMLRACLVRVKRERLALELAERLHRELEPLHHAVEWCLSCDWSEDSVVEAACEVLKKADEKAVLDDKAHAEAEAAEAEALREHAIDLPPPKEPS